MQYLYYLDKKYNDEEIIKTKEKIMAYYPNEEIVFVDGNNNDPSLSIFPDTLLVKGYKGEETPCTVILDSTTQVSSDNFDFINKFCRLMDLNVYLSFYRFPHLNTENIINIIGIINCDYANTTKVNEEVFRKVLEYQYNVFKTNIDTKVGIISQRSKKLMDSRKDSHIKVRVKNLIKENSKTFGGSMTDTDILRMIEDKKIYVSRKSFYNWKNELKEELGQN